PYPDPGGPSTLSLISGWYGRLTDKYDPLKKPLTKIKNELIRSGAELDSLNMANGTFTYDPIYGTPISASTAGYLMPGSTTDIALGIGVGALPDGFLGELMPAAEGSLASGETSIYRVQAPRGEPIMGRPQARISADGVTGVGRTGQALHVGDRAFVES